MSSTNDNSKEIKRQLDSYVSVLTHKLGRTPTLEEIQYALSDGAVASDTQKSTDPSIAVEAEKSEQNSQPLEQSNENKGQDEESMDLSEGEDPVVAGMKIYHGMSLVDGVKKPDPYKILFYEDPKGGIFYNCKTKEWTDSKPEVLDHLHTRDMTGEDQDIIYAIMHGVMSDSDYYKLSNAGLVSETSKTLWDKLKMLKEQIEQYNNMQKSEYYNQDDDELSKDEVKHSNNDTSIVDGLKGVMDGNQEGSDGQIEHDIGDQQEQIPDSVIRQIVDHAQKASLLSIEKSVREIVRDELEKLFSTTEDESRTQSMESVDQPHEDELHKKVPILD